MLADTAEFSTGRGGNYSILNRYLNTVRPQIDWAGGLNPCVLTIDADADDGEVAPLTFTSAFPTATIEMEWHWGPVITTVLALPAFCADLATEILADISDHSVELHTFDLVDLGCDTLAGVDPLGCVTAVGQVRAGLARSGTFTDLDAILTTEVVTTFCAHNNVELAAVIELLPVDVAFNADLIAATLAVSLT